MGTGLRFPELGARIEQALRVLGLTKAQFIEKYRYDPRKFYPWTKKRMPEFESLRKLARQLGVPMAWLLLGDEGVAEVLAWEKSHRKIRGDHDHSVI